MEDALSNQHVGFSFPEYIQEYIHLVKSGPGGGITAIQRRLVLAESNKNRTQITAFTTRLLLYTPGDECRLATNMCHCVYLVHNNDTRLTTGDEGSVNWEITTTLILHCKTIVFFSTASFYPSVLTVESWTVAALCIHS